MDRRQDDPELTEREGHSRIMIANEHFIDGRAIAGTLSGLLLDHDGLMTPRLSKAFGELTAAKRSHCLSETSFNRASLLCRKVDGQVILRAKLNIMIAELPEPLIDQLEKSDQLFGQLLIKYGVKVKFANRQLLRHGHGCYGRKLQMLSVNTGKIVCEVAEFLENEASLIRLCDREYSTMLELGS